MPTVNASSRVLLADQYHGQGFTNENTLSRAYATKPDVIDPVITHLVGKESNKFPLTFMTEGRPDGIKWKELNDIQYEWNTFRRLKQSDTIVSHSYTSTSKPGLGFSDILVTMETRWLKVQHNVHTRNGYRLRVMAQPTKTATNNWQYRLRMVSGTMDSYVPYTEFTVGWAIGMVGAATVSQSYSMGNESNVQSPGKMKNQLQIMRKSYRWGGNVENKIMEFQFSMEGQGTTKYWMPFERWQHTLNWKQAVEEQLWYSEYNRQADGKVELKDEDTGLEIPEGAGVLAQIPNNDTYSTLTAKKLKNTVGDVMWGGTDTGKMDIILYTGKGGLREFDNAMKEEAKGLGFTLIQDNNKFITGSGRNLILGGYFTQYEHVDGHKITVAPLNILDYGGQAEIAAKHPETNFPITSYEMLFVDQSMYDGVPNVQMAIERGRGMRTGLLQGMNTPIDFAGNDKEYIATEQDASSVHFLASKGICIRRNTHCFRLTCEVA